MKIQIAARFNAIVWPAVLFYTVVILRPGLRITGVHFPRQGWIATNESLWTAGGWLWLLAIFGWLWLLIALAWSYLPAQRLASMLQAGLLIIGTTLAISGVIVWMTALLPAIRQENVTMLAPLVDALALGLIGGGTFMSGMVTLWVALDLYRQGVLARGWLALCIGAGLCALPTPFLLPFPYLLAVAALCWWGWALYLAFQSPLPGLDTAWK